MMDRPEPAFTRSDAMQDVSRALKAAIFGIADANEAALRSQSLQRTDYSCLMYLAERSGPVSPKELITHLGVTSGAVTGILDRLERQGYIRRGSNPDDRRGTLVTLVPERALGFTTAFTEIQAGFEACTLDMSDADLATVTRFLDYVAGLARCARATIEAEVDAGT